MSGPAMCPICRHSQRASIDEHLQAGRDLRTLADEFGVRTTGCATIVRSTWPA
jgi:hypothetical protein